MAKKFERLAILGVGLIGGAVGLAARKARLAKKVVGYCRRPEAAGLAVETGCVEQCFTDPAAAARDADFAVLATGPDSVAAIAAGIAPVLAENAVVTDVASVKSRAVALCTEALAPRARFVGSHPLAGSERRGAGHAAGVKLSGAVCVLTPTRSTDRGALALVRSFWTAMGLRVLELPPEEHDARLARTSHLPHFVAAALAAAARPGDEPFCAMGWRDATRIAAGDPGLWTEIALANREALAAELYRLARALHDAADTLTAADAEGVRRLLEAGRDRRGEIIREA